MCRDCDPRPARPIYGAAKAGLINLTQTLAMEWAPPVRVNCVSAGLLDTGAGDDFYGGAGGWTRFRPRSRSAAWARPSTWPRPVSSWPRPAAGFASGANLVLDGGGEVPPFLTALGQ